MDSRKLASIMITALALWACDGTPVDPPLEGETFPERDKVCAAGAAQPCATTEDAHTVAERTHEVGTEHNDATFVYVVNRLSIPEADDGVVAGFNLDGIDSGAGSDDAEDCQGYAPDYVSSTDPDHIGVDNALEALVGILAEQIVSDTCAGMADELGCTLGEQINEGAVLLLLEVSGVESLEYDTDVQLQLFLGAVPEGETLTVEGGALAAGQTFDVMANLGAPVGGDIFDGRLRATTPQLQLALTVDGMNVPLTITNPEIRADVSATGLTNGAIGGELTIADLQETVEMLGLDFDIEGVAGSFADLSPSAADPLTCEGLSVGITFGATSAMRN